MSPVTGRMVQVRRLREREELLEHLRSLQIELPLAQDDEVAKVLGDPVRVGPWTVPNRFAILPMEGWDGTADGRPTELVERRWQRFGASGAGLIWGGEAVAVVPEGRANPNQLCIGEHSASDLASLREQLLAHHPGQSDGEPPVVGLQLTHSGRWSRPTGTPSPRIAYRHPITDERVGATDASLLSDAELDDLVGRFVHAAVLAQQAGFDFVDVKHCHGYLLHELLSAHDRAGEFGGSFEHRTRFLRDVVAGIRHRAPGLAVALRLSVYDFAPFGPGDERVGQPEHDGPYRYAFGGDGTGLGIDLTEPHAMLDLCRDLGIGLVSITAGSPYYTPHIQRPAYFPPSDGYLPPEDPLAGVVRLVDATAQLAAAHPDLAIVTGGMSYLQDWIAHAGQRLVAEGKATAIGLGRMALSYPDLPADVLGGLPLDRHLVCRTLSDCTTAPRNGMVSGCYPLDDFYKDRPERAELVRIKRSVRTA